ncbi:monothiol glutaredoxin-S17-like [Prunus avium]|uniref:Monothiol glutaredoxin-S17-like n=1 Tax=Prunus avium TaxID=42229 RepID=A0A6P5SGS7_PRUAV|nr:monothiol glutaredoxin-S17-like [Prunus avium]
MAVTLLKYYEVEFGSFDLLTDNEVMEGIQKYSNWPHLPQIYFEGRARGFRHIETLMKDIMVKEPKTTELIDEDEELMDEDEELMDEEQRNEIKTFLILHRGLLVLLGERLKNQRVRNQRVKNQRAKNLRGKNLRVKHQRVKN